MKKYKLIKEYPGCEKLHFIIDDKNCQLLGYHHLEYEEKLSKYSEFWEEVIENNVVFDTYGKSYYHKQSNGKWRCHGKYNQVNPVDTINYTIKDNEIGKTRYVIKQKEVVEKDYEILSFKDSINSILTRDTNSNTFKSFSVKHFTEKELLEDKCEIHSVKRLSDGEVFTGSDKTKYGYIVKMYISNNILMVKTHLDIMGRRLDIIEKLKKPLFTTEDNVDIFEGNKVWGIDVDYWKPFYRNAKVNINIQKDWKYGKFSTKKAAEEYILMNKPCLSINDVLSIPRPSRNKNRLSSAVRKEFSLNKLINLVKKL